MRLRMLPVVVFWIWLCAYLNCAGWVLSACHGLDQAGYAVVFGAGLVATLAWWKKSGALFSPPDKYALVSERFFRNHPDSTIDTWIERMNAKVVSTYDLKFLAGPPPGRWLPVQFR